jgi:uncharacterized membrane protein YphA (DoxX/SURF4 family)
MKTSTRVFLVLLRLAIGWHLLVEGVTKVESLHHGATARGPVWSSKPYLLESSGPFSGWFRSIAGDPDEAALNLLRVPSGQSLPPKLQTVWDDYFTQWCSHYGLTEQQQPKAKEIYQKHLEEASKWFREGTTGVVKAFPTGSVKVNRTTAERLAEYEQALKDQHTLERALVQFNHAIWQDRLKTAKAEVAKLRAELLKEIEDRTNSLHRELSKLLTPDQVGKGRYAPPPETNRLLWFTDLATAWGLTILGGMLLLGLLTRLASVGSMGLLLLFYLAMPPLPWLPENPRSEGHYLLVNKTLIEIIALGVLASVPSGRWAGLDALLALVFRRGGGDTNTDRKLSA